MINIKVGKTSGMKIQQIASLINRIENKFEVDKWKIDNIHIWPVIRMDLYMNLYYERFKGTDSTIDLLFKVKEGIKIAIGLARYLFFYFRDYRKNDSFGPLVDAVFLGDGVSKIFIKKSWYDKFCDPFIEYFKGQGKKTLFLEISHRYLVPRYSPSIFVQLFLDFELVKSVFFHSVIDSKSYSLAGFEDFLMFIESKNLRIPTPDLNRILQIVSAIKAYSKFFKKVLCKTKPSLAFVAGYYGPRGMAFNLACRELGIKSVDIQHGIIDEYHGAYGNWSKVPSKGFELLPSFFWCWRKNEEKVIKKWSGKILKWHKPLIGGNLFFQTWKDDVREFIVELDKLFKEYKRKVNILVTLSSIDTQNEILFKELLNIIRKSDPKWMWWIRLHPCRLEKRQLIRERLIAAKVLNFNLDQASDLPLYAIFRNIDVHIAYASAAIIEAAQFGVPSVVVSKDESSYFQEEIVKKLVIAATRSNDIKKAINFFLSRKNKLNKGKRYFYQREKKALNFLLSEITRNGI